MISLVDVSKSFDGGATYAVRDLSLHIDRGETLVLLGSSGCGKSTTLKVRQNVSIGLKLAGWDKGKRAERADEMLQLVGLSPAEFGFRLPNELSGGQQQRVGVARALASDPDYLLMDEPFGALDALTRDDLQQQMLQLKQHLHKTIVFVTHDIFEGRLEQIGTPQEVVGAPATQFVRDLFGKPAKQLASFRDVLNER